MSKLQERSHNKTTLLYHLVCAVKYRRNVLTEDVTDTIVNVCMEIQEKYGIEFIEIGTDVNHIHYLIQTPPKYSPTQIVTMIKSITAKELYRRHSETRGILWGGNIWTSVFYANTVGAFGDEIKIKIMLQTKESTRKFLRNN